MKFKQFDFSPNSINNDERSVIITASTNETDRQGDIVQPTAFNLEKIQSLPILLNHSPQQPVGKTLWAKITNSALLLKIYISDKTQLAKDTWELVKEGIISFASVGFLPVKYSQIETGYNYEEVDLVETSLTCTPANSGAITLALKTIQDESLKIYFENLLDIEKMKSLETENELLKKQLQENEEFKKSLEIKTKEEKLNKIYNKLKNL